MVKRCLRVERSLRWLLEVPSEEKGMPELGQDHGERTGKVIPGSMKGQGGKLFASLDSSEGREREEEDV